MFSNTTKAILSTLIVLAVAALLVGSGVYTNHLIVDPAHDEFNLIGRFATESLTLDTYEHLIDSVDQAVLIAGVLSIFMAWFIIARKLLIAIGMAHMGLVFLWFSQVPQIGAAEADVVTLGWDNYTIMYLAYAFSVAIIFFGALLIQIIQKSGYEGTHLTIYPGNLDDTAPATEADSN